MGGPKISIAWPINLPRRPRAHARDGRGEARGRGFREGATQGPLDPIDSQWASFAAGSRRYPGTPLAEGAEPADLLSLSGRVGSRDILLESAKRFRTFRTFRNVASPRLNLFDSPERSALAAAKRKQAPAGDDAILVAP